jgi:hypothetical protein
LPAPDGNEFSRGLAFLGQGAAVSKSGRVYFLTEGVGEGEWWFPMTLEAQLELPGGIWSDVSGASDGLNSVFFFSYVDASFELVLRVAKADLSTGVPASATLMSLPAGLPAVPEFTAGCGHVTADGAHFYVAIGGDLYHVTADSPGVLSASSAVEGATLALPGGTGASKVLVSPDGGVVLVLSAGVVHRFSLGTPYSLASASSLGAVTLDANHDYEGLSYFYPYEYLFVHRNVLGGDAVEMVEPTSFGDVTTADYAARAFLRLLTAAPAVVVSDTPPAAPFLNQLWLDIS